VPKLSGKQPRTDCSECSNPNADGRSDRFPVVHLLSASTDLVLRVLGIGPPQSHTVTEEEIKVLIEQGTEAGTFEEAEQDMVERVFRLGDRPVNALVTTTRYCLVGSRGQQEETDKIMESAHSRFPVCQGGLDNVLGMLPTC